MEEPVQSIMERIPGVRCDWVSNKNHLGNQERLVRLRGHMENKGSLKSRRSSHCTQCVSHDVARSHPIQKDDQLPSKPQKIHRLAVYSMALDHEGGKNLGGTSHTISDWDLAWEEKICTLAM